MFGQIKNISKEILYWWIIKMLYCKMYVYIISREKNPHIPEVASEVTKRLIGNIPLTNGFGCYKFIELFYIK